MDVGIIAVVILVVINITGVAYSYGMLSQKVKDLCRRLDRVEKAINNRGDVK